MLDHGVDVGRGGTAHVDDEAGVLLAHRRAAGLVALEAGVGDQLAGEVALGALEGGAGARQLERLLLLALVGEVVHGRADLLGVTGVEAEGGRKHDPALVGDAALTVAEVELACRHVDDRAVGKKDADLLERVGHAAAVGARVHEARAADRARDAAGELEAGKPQLAGHLGGLAQADARLAADLVVLDAHAHEAVGHGDDHAAVALIGNKKVRAAAQNKIVDAGVFARRDDVAHLVEVLGDDVEVGRATDLEGGVLAHRLVYQQVLFADDGTEPPFEGTVALGHLFLSLGHQK